MRKKSELLVVTSLFIGLIAILLVGCEMSYSQREKKLKELLSEKYGEEFEVREMYVTGDVEA